MQHHGRGFAVAALALVVVVLTGVSPAYADGIDPGFRGIADADASETAPRVDERIAHATKWRPNRLAKIAGGSARVAWLGLEPYNATGVTYGGLSLRVRWGSYQARTGTAFVTWQLQARAICRDDVTGAQATLGVWPSASNGVPNVNTAHDTLYTSVMSRRNEAQGEQIRRYIVVSATACGTGKTVVGMQVRLAEYDDATSSEYFSSEHTWHVDNPNRGPRIPDEQWDLDVCEAVFGPPPWFAGKTGLWQGNVVSVEDTPCLDLEDDWETDFTRVCANPPPFDFYEVLGLSVFPTVESLGEWIGHYANCLFVPRGGFETDTIGEAAEGGWMGDTRTILAAVAADFGGTGGMSASASWEQRGGRRGVEFPGVEVDGGVIFEDEETARKWLGDELLDSVANGPVVPLRGSNFAPMAVGCGEFVEALPVVGESISSCSLGSVWPDSFRTAAGALLMITAAFSALFAILRFMGVKYGWSTG